MQLNILDAIEAERLGNEGLTRAVDKAEKDFPEWKERCWELFKRWLSKKPEGYQFMMEEFRNDCIKWGKIEEPNSNTAFGFVSRRTSSPNFNLIKNAGTAKTKSVNSHGTPANVWQKV